MADPETSPFCRHPNKRICALQQIDSLRVTSMLTFLIYLARRKRGYVWAPAVDLSDPYVAAALAPVTHN